MLGYGQAEERQEASEESGWQGWGRRGAEGVGKRGDGFIRQYRGRNWAGWDRQSLKALMNDQGRQGSLVVQGQRRWGDRMLISNSVP